MRVMVGAAAIAVVSLVGCRKKEPQAAPPSAAPQVSVAPVARPNPEQKALPPAAAVAVRTDAPKVEENEPEKGQQKTAEGAEHTEHGEEAAGASGGDQDRLASDLQPCEPGKIGFEKRRDAFGAPPKSFAVLGGYSAGGLEGYGVYADLDWRAIASKVPGVDPDRPLTLQERKKQLDLSDWHSDARRPWLTFRASADTAPGAYYLLDRERVESTALKELRGSIYVELDESGCEDITWDESRKRGATGVVFVTRGPKSGLGGFLVRSAGPLEFVHTAAVATRAGEDVRVSLVTQDGGERSWVAKVGFDEPAELKGAAVISVKGTGERFVLVQGSNEGNCATQLRLFVIEGDALRTVGWANTDCDL